MSCSDRSNSDYEPSDLILDEDNNEGPDDADENAPGADRSRRARPVSAPTRVRGDEKKAFQRVKARVGIFGLRENRSIYVALVALMPGGQMHYQGDAPLLSAMRGVESEVKGAVSCKA